MSTLLKSLLVTASLALALPATAQDAPAGETPTEAAEPEGTGNALADQLSLGEEVGGAPQLGQTYVREEFGDWQLRCIRTNAEDTGSDPCSLYQLLADGEGNSVAEISIFRLPEGGQAIAGATVITPLETLLTQQVTIAVDSGNPKRYPFSFCSQVGCFSRIGLTDGDVSAFKRGAKATITIVPVAAPDQKVELDVSLSGFTAGFDGTPVAQDGN